MANTLSFTAEQYSIINGSLLGDGCIAKGRGNKLTCSFSKCQTERRIEYLEWHLEKLNPFSSSIKTYDNYALGKKYRKSTLITHTHEDFKYLRDKWYPNGKKIVPLDLKLDPLSIGIWFCDDGSNCVEARLCKFATYCFTFEECSFLCELLLGFGIHSYVSKQNVIIICAKSYGDFVNLIKPHVVWDCFNYKLKYRESKYILIDDDKAIEIFRLYNEKELNQSEIAIKVGVDIAAVSDILRGKRKKYLNLSTNPIVALNNTSGVSGVCWDKNRNKWRVSARINGKNKYIGRFKTKQEAIEARTKFVA